jgi:hypothetical protein
MAEDPGSGKGGGKGSGGSGGGGSSEAVSIKIEAHWEYPDAKQFDSSRIIEAWRQHAQEIAEIEHGNISGRTPKQTGTLDSSLTDLLNPDKQTIAQVYTDPDTQLSGPWERVYAQYQEGNPLGHPTYTRGNLQYVYHAHDEDIQQIQDWARKVAQEAADKMSNDAQEGSTKGEASAIIAFDVPASE